MSRHVADEERELLSALQRLDEIEALAEGSPGYFGKRMIDEEAFFVRLTRLRRVLPPYLQQSLDLLQEREQLLEDARSRSHALREAARREAEEIRNTAQHEALHLVEAARSRREQLLQQASDRAGNVVMAAQQESMSRLAEHPLVTREWQSCAALREDAEQQAQEMRQAAQQEARELEAEAARYTTELLEKVGAAIVKLQQKVQRDRIQFAVSRTSSDD